MFRPDFEKLPDVSIIDIDPTRTDEKQLTIKIDLTSVSEPNKLQTGSGNFSMIKSSSRNPVHSIFPEAGNTT